MQERYERHHQCIFEPEALSAAVSLSARYIPDRFLPDKAIDVMDEAGSRMRIQACANRRAAVLGRHHLQEWEQLVNVLDSKDEMLQVSIPALGCMHCLLLHWHHVQDDLDAG